MIKVRNQYVLAAMAVLGLTTGLLTAQLMKSEAQDLDAPECAGFGRYSFEGAETIEDVARLADLVVRGTVLDRRVAVDRYDVIEGSPSLDHINRINLVIHSVKVNEVLHGRPQGEVIEVGNAFSYCLERGAEYYLFLREVRSADEAYVEDPAVVQSPVNYAIGRFGRANAFKIENGQVMAEEQIGHTGVVRYQDVPEARFKSDVMTAVAAVSDR